jgi:hypothetical protein
MKNVRGTNSPAYFLLISLTNKTVFKRCHKVVHTHTARPNKHRDPKWSKSRAAKVLKIDLPDMDFRRRTELQQAIIYDSMSREFLLRGKDQYG